MDRERLFLEFDLGTFWNFDKNGEIYDRVLIVGIIWISNSELAIFKHLP